MNYTPRRTYSFRKPKSMMRKPIMVKPTVTLVKTSEILLSTSEILLSTCSNLLSISSRRPVNSISKCAMWLNWVFRSRGMALSSDKVPFSAISLSASLHFFSRNFSKISVVSFSNIINSIKNEIYVKRLRTLVGEGKASFAPTARRTGFILRNIMRTLKGAATCAATLVLLLLGTVPNIYANNVQVGTMTYENKNDTTIDLVFNVSQKNTFSTTTVLSEDVADCIWLFVKFSTGPEAYSHATITATSAGSAALATIVTPSDKKGVFIFPNESLAQWNSNGVTLRWEYTNDGLTSLSSVTCRVNAVEMVKVPTGAFYFANLPTEGERTALPDLTALGYPASGDIYVNSASAYLPTGASAGWPNGYSTFYLGKYEVSQQQYCDFLNTLDGWSDNTGAANARFLNMYDNVENAIKHDGSKYVADTSTVSAKAGDLCCNYLSWDDTLTYLSWSALRPMTEMEFEKAARAGVTRAVDVDDYPWGTTAPSADMYTPAGQRDAYDAHKYFANWYDNANNVYGVGAQPDGVTYVGNYLSGDETRTNEQKGCSPYGIADLAGNVWEHLINCAYTTTPNNGDGDTDFADESWPTAASGHKGIRGGAWNDGATHLRVSDRHVAGWTNATRYNNVGFRPARTP